MFKLDMEAIRKTANVVRLMANPANVAIPANKPEIEPVIVSQLAKLAALAISHDANETEKALVTTRLLIAAMQVCDHHGDNKAAREAMRRDCLATPDDLKPDLLECLRFTRPQPKKADPQPQPKKAAPEPPADPAAWHELAVAYNAHHFNCKTCCAAGQGRGLRCGVGATLWTSYQNTEEKS